MNWFGITQEDLQGIASFLRDVFAESGSLEGHLTAEEKEELARLRERVPKLEALSRLGEPGEREAAGSALVKAKARLAQLEQAARARASAGSPPRAASAPGPAPTPAPGPPPPAPSPAPGPSPRPTTPSEVRFCRVLDKIYGRMRLPLGGGYGYGQAVRVDRQDLSSLLVKIASMFGVTVVADGADRRTIVFFGRDFGVDAAEIVTKQALVHIELSPGMTPAMISSYLDSYRNSMSISRQYALVVESEHAAGYLKVWGVLSAEQAEERKPKPAKRGKKR